MTIRDGYLTANGLRFHYAAAGDPDLPLLLFLHGFPDFWAGWRPVMERLSDRFHCVAPDQRGYNLSDKPQDVSAYRPKHLIEDVRLIARHFVGDRPFRLVAHDWGGAIAWAFALKHPDLLVRLAICNAVHPGVFQREMAQNPAQRAASQYINRHRDPDAEARIIADDYKDLSVSVTDLAARGAIGPDQIAEYREAWTRPGALTGMLNWYRAMKISTPTDMPVTGDAAPYDPKALIVNTKTLVVWGMEDQALLPGCINGLEEFVPDLTLVKVPGAGHFVTLERPDLVADQLGAFMTAA